MEIGGGSGRAVVRWGAVALAAGVLLARHVRHPTLRTAGLAAICLGSSLAWVALSPSALVFLAEHLRQRGYTLFDIQMVTPHTAQFRPRLISRRDYLRRLGAVPAPA